MNTKLYPCIWFDNNAREAAEFYCSVFEDARVASAGPMVVIFELNGTRFMGLNGGAQFSPSPAVSYFAYGSGDADKTRQWYARLSEGGKVRMPLDKYDWSPLYAWVEDKFGVNWQLDVDAINNPQKVVPAFLFANEKSGLVDEAVEFYTSVFKESTRLMAYPEGGPVIFAQFRAHDCIFNAMSGGAEKHAFDFTEGNSTVIECDNQEEIDYYWKRFADGGKESRCGWIQDRYGVWWQVIPAELSKLMNDPATKEAVTAAMMQMAKFDIAALRRAANRS